MEKIDEYFKFLCIVIIAVFPVNRYLRKLLQNVLY